MEQELQGIPYVLKYKYLGVRLNGILNGGGSFDVPKAEVVKEVQDSSYSIMEASTNVAKIVVLEYVCISNF